MNGKRERSLRERSRRVPRAVVHRCVEWLRHYPCVPLRRAVAERGATWPARLPASVRRRLDLDGELVEPLRVEIGPGVRPTPGYVHIDADRLARHLEHVVTTWDLPFPDESIDEILAVHVLEHVPPRLLCQTLCEWHRALVPGGTLRVHVPDSAALMRAYLAAPVDEKWGLIGAILGMYANASVRKPEELAEPPDHHTLFDESLLRSVLLEAGFIGLRNRSQTDSDIHTRHWRPLVDQISLIIEARKPVVKDGDGTV